MKRRSRYINFTKARTEPSGWPLNRPATAAEWQHVIKAKMVRRVPKTRSAYRLKLLEVVTDDIGAANAAGKIYLGADAETYINISGVLTKLTDDKVLRLAMGEVVGPLGPFQSLCVFRTPFTEEWESLIPATVKAVLNYLPVTDVLDLLVDALIDDES